jgi:phosphohistidine swiveling domain-containing protein
MADDKLAELLKTQKSLTEWLEDINHLDVAELRKEDNEKRERLRILNDIIGLPFDKPTQFEATDLSKKTTKFEKFLNDRGKELCALRLIPKVGNLPKLRMRGKTISDTYKWYLDQDIDPTKYRADFVPHPPDYSWATIFIVNKKGIQGEIIYGGHHQLTQGFYDKEPPIVFRYDFKSWQMVPNNKEALAHLKKLIKIILVNSEAKRSKLNKELNSTFAENYLEGYFETSDSSMGTWYIDYSPSIGKLYKDAILMAPTLKDIVNVTGQIGSPGIAEGTVAIVTPNKLDSYFKPGSVLVCNVTTPDYVPIMRKASAIVTDQGGILSHAAIVARELKIPCVVATGNATKILNNGQHVVVDANRGIILCQNP